jgi:Family of unknown function (DUF6101)
MQSDGSPGSGRGHALRLDPNALPLRFHARDAAADGAVREVELTRERVVMRRTLSGMRMALNMPVSAFTGVALKLSCAGLSVVLAHRDPALALPLSEAGEAEDALTIWNDWGRALALPLLVEDEAGLRDAHPRLGALRIFRARPRRRRRSPLKRRRPSILLRRKTGRALSAMSVHRGEREIIARN